MPEPQPLPESTVDTRIAERLEALLTDAVGAHLRGGVAFFEEPQQLEHGTLQLPVLAGFLETFGDRIREKRHTTGVLLMLVTEVRTARDRGPERFWRARFCDLVQRVIFDAGESGQLVQAGDARYLFGLTRFDQRPPYYLGRTQSHLVTPLRLEVETSRQLYEPTL